MSILKTPQSWQWSWSASTRSYFYNVIVVQTVTTTSSLHGELCTISFHLCGQVLCTGVYTRSCIILPGKCHTHNKRSAVQNLDVCLLWEMIAWVANRLDLRPAAELVDGPDPICLHMYNVCFLHFKGLYRWMQSLLTLWCDPTLGQFLSHDKFDDLLYQGCYLW